MKLNALADTVMTFRRVRSFAVLALGLAAATVACSGGSKSSPTTPTPTVVTPAPPSVSSVAVSGPAMFTVAGGTAQFTAVATLSNGTTEDRTTSAIWTSQNTVVATVTAGGVVTALADGDTGILATIGEVRGTREIAVRLPRRTPDPPAGSRLPLPDVRAVVERAAAERPDLLAQSCPSGFKYENNPWLDYMVDRLRALDTRWGYNGKPTRTPVDNGGRPVIAAGDEIAYHYGPGPDERSPDVHLVDILVGHCGPTPSVTWRVFTGEEPGFWTSARRF